MPTRHLFRMIDPGFGRRNIFRFAAAITISLGPVMVATAARRLLSWLEAEVISENNCRKRRGAPLGPEDLIDHGALQRQRRATIIGISASITNAVPRALEIIETYIKMPAELRPTAIIVGGWHAGDDPEPFLKAGADVVVHGEADLVIGPLIEALINGQSLAEIPGISYRVGEEIKRNGITNRQQENSAPGQKGFLVVPQEEMDSLPDPDFGLVRFAKIKIMPLNRTRGCSGRCKFCRVKGTPRHLPPERLLFQIQRLYSQGTKKFFLIDDRSEEDLASFTTWLELLKEWINTDHIKGLTIATQNRLSLADHPHILGLMREAHIETVCIGFESPIAQELGAMAKPTNPRKMLQWAKTWKDQGFLIHCMMIFGYPIPENMSWPSNPDGTFMTARQRAKVFWRFIKKINPTYLQLLIFSPIIGTEDHKRLETGERLLPDIPLEHHDGLHIMFKPDEGMTAEEVQKQAMWLSRKFYARRVWRFQWVALVLHSLKVGTVVCSMPFIWVAILPFKGWQARLAWQWPKRHFRISINRWGAQFIIAKFLASFASFQRLLNRVSHGKKSV